MRIAETAGFAEPLEVLDSATLDEVFRFRASVWQAALSAQGRQFRLWRWSDDVDAVGRHWVIRDAHGGIAAAARLSFHASIHQVPEAEQYLRHGLRPPGPVAAPARIVVAPEMQRHGLATRLVEAQDEAIRRSPARWAVRQASPAMARLLAGRGWRIVGPALADPLFPGIDFQVCIKNVGEATKITCSREAA